MTFMWRHPDIVVKMSYQSFFINYKLSDLLLIMENTLFLNSRATMFANGCTCTRQASSIKRSVLKVCLNITTAAYITSLRTRWQLDLDIIDWIEPGIKPTWTLLLISWLEVNWWLGHSVLVTLARIVSRWRDMVVIVVFKQWFDKWCFKCIVIKWVCGCGGGGVVGRLEWAFPVVKHRPISSTMTKQQILWEG